MMSIASTTNSEAEASIVSDVSELTSPVGTLLVDLACELSDDSGSTWFVVLTILVGEGVVLLHHWTDGSGSPVEEPPLLVIVWLVVLNAESELVTTNVLVPEQSSVFVHS